MSNNSGMFESGHCTSIISFKMLKIDLRDMEFDNKLQGGPKKRHIVYGTIISQPCITESCGFQQNVLKEILYMTKFTV